jgi:hypothetical protein
LAIQTAFASPRRIHAGKHLDDVLIQNRVRSLAGFFFATLTMESAFKMPKGWPAPTPLKEIKIHPLGKRFFHGHFKLCLKAQAVLDEFA